jgi:hypothetical protein
MSKRWLWLLVVVMVLLWAGFNLVANFWLGLSSVGSFSHPSIGISDSKSHGAFVAAVGIEPEVVQWKGREIKIGEAWIERRV